MHCVVAKGSIVPPRASDGNTAVIMTGGVYGMAFGSNVLAVTLVTPRNNHLIEADVIFNSSRTWDSYRGPLRSDAMDFHRVALHEFGHVVGLDHPDQASPKQTVNAIMNSTISGLDSLAADDINGGHSLYDTGPHYQRSGAAPKLL